MADIVSDFASDRGPGVAGRTARALVARPASFGSSQRQVMVGAALLLRIVSAGLVAAIGIIHLHLWLDGYREIGTIGPLFMLNAISGILLAALLLVWPRLVAGLLALGFVASSLAALLLSINVGLFGFREFTSVAFVMPSIVIECIAIVTVVAWMVLVAIELKTAGAASERER